MGFGTTDEDGNRIFGEYIIVMERIDTDGTITYKITKDKYIEGLLLETRITIVDEDNINVLSFEKIIYD